jgi:hypothetical protein
VAVKTEQQTDTDKPAIDLPIDLVSQSPAMTTTEASSSVSDMQADIYAVHWYRKSDPADAGIWLVKSSDGGGTFTKMQKLTDTDHYLNATLGGDKLILYSNDKILIFNLRSGEMRSLASPGYIADVQPTSDALYFLTNSDPACIDFPSSRTMCTSNLYVELDGVINEIASGMPGSKGLQAYTPDEVALLRDGYADAGCQDVTYTAYSVTERKTLGNVFEDAHCSDDQRTYESYRQSINSYLSSLEYSNVFVTHQYEAFSLKGDNFVGTELPDDNEIIPDIPEISIPISIKVLSNANSN